MINVVTETPGVSAEPQFTRAEYAHLKQAQQLLWEAQELLPKIENCGMECEYFRDMIADWSERLGRWERTYFSGKDWEGIEVETPGMAALGPLFNRVDWERLKAMQRLIHDTLPQIDKAESCGVDCTTWKAELADRAARLSAVEKNFMPVAPG